jgi:hypothetical protein
LEHAMADKTRPVRPVMGPSPAESGEKDQPGRPARSPTAVVGGNAQPNADKLELPKEVLSERAWIEANGP